MFLIPPGTTMNYLERKSDWVWNSIKTPRFNVNFPNLCKCQTFQSATTEAPSHYYCFLMKEVSLIRVLVIQCCLFNNYLEEKTGC